MKLSIKFEDYAPYDFDVQGMEMRPSFAVTVLRALADDIERQETHTAAPKAIRAEMRPPTKETA